MTKVEWKLCLAQRELCEGLATRPRDLNLTLTEANEIAFDIVERMKDGTEFHLRSFALMLFDNLIQASSLLEETSYRKSDWSGFQRTARTDEALAALEALANTEDFHV